MERSHLGSLHAYLMSCDIHDFVAERSCHIDNPSQVWNKYINFMSPLPKPLFGECKPSETYGLRWFHRTGDGVNQSRCCEVLASTRNCVLHGNAAEALVGQWSYCCTSMGQGSCVELDGASRSSNYQVTVSTKILTPNRISQRGLIGQWQYHCTSTGQDSSIELEMAWISPVVMELHCQKKDLGVTVSAKFTRTDGRTDGNYFIDPFTFLWKGVTQKLQHILVDLCNFQTKCTLVNDYNMTGLIFVGNGINFSIAKGLISLHMPICVTKASVCHHTLNANQWHCNFSIHWCQKQRTTFNYVCWFIVNMFYCGRIIFNGFEHTDIKGVRKCITSTSSLDDRHWGQAIPIVRGHHVTNQWE